MSSVQHNTASSPDLGDETKMCSELDGFSRKNKQGKKRSKKKQNVQLFKKWNKVHPTEKEQVGCPPLLNKKLNTMFNRKYAVYQSMKNHGERRSKLLESVQIVNSLKDGHVQGLGIGRRFMGLDLCECK